MFFEGYFLAVGFLRYGIEMRGGAGGDIYLSTLQQVVARCAHMRVFQVCC